LLNVVKEIQAISPKQILTSHGTVMYKMLKRCN